MLHAEIAFELFKEADQIEHPDLEALEIFCETLPHSLELFEIFSKLLQNVIVWKVVHLKLLDDDHDEEVQHHVGADHDERDEKDGRVRHPAVNSLHAIV